MEDHNIQSTHKPHLSLERRFAIEAALNAGRSFYDIAKEVNVHHSTISREVRARRERVDIGAAGRSRAQPLPEANAMQ